MTNLTKKPLQNIITLKGEFPGDILAPLLDLARILGPYDECSGDAEDGDILVLFELLEVHNVFNEEFRATLREAGLRVHKFEHDHSRLPEREMVRRMDRFNRALARIRSELAENGYKLVGWMLSEMLGLQHYITDALAVQKFGIATARRKLLDTRRLLKKPTESEEDFHFSFRWFEFVELASRVPINDAPRIIGATDMRAVLRTVELDLSDNLGMVLPYQFRRLPYNLTVFPSKHPLNIARVGVHDRVSKQMVMYGEVGRDKGHIAFPGCSLGTMQAMFTDFKADHMYMLLRDMFTCGLFKLLTEGVVKEKSYISSTDEEENEEAPAETATPEPYAPYVPSHPDPVVEVVGVPENEPARPRIGPGKLSYRNILATLMGFGVTVTRDSKHTKLRLGERTGGFLNRHRSEDPHYNRKILRQALEQLGLDEATFMEKLISS